MTQLKFIPNDIRVIKGNKRGGNGSGGLKIYCKVYYYVCTFCYHKRASYSLKTASLESQVNEKGNCCLDWKMMACFTLLDIFSGKRSSKKVFWDWDRRGISPVTYWIRDFPDEKRISNSSSQSICREKLSHTQKSTSSIEFVVFWFILKFLDEGWNCGPLEDQTYSLICRKVICS